MFELKFLTNKCFKFGYTARRRSLIEDAKFEQKVLKSTQSIDPVEEIENEIQSDPEVVSLYKLIVSVENQQSSLVKLIDTLQVYSFLNVSFVMLIYFFPFHDAFYPYIR